jgi:hypothetical protein
MPKNFVRIDAFYKVSENENVCLRYAVTVGLMEMYDEPKEKIDKILKKAREFVYTAY